MVLAALPVTRIMRLAKRCLRRPQVTARRRILLSQIRYVTQEIVKPNAYLLPLRLFIGIGWIRAGLEKVTEQAWTDGAALIDFVDEQIGNGEVVFPLYRSFLENVITPNATAVGWLVMIGQLLIGVAILTGTFTNLSLLLGLTMNLNFLLAGRIDPSAFYIIIQSVLFVSMTGAILGVDSLLSRRIHYGLLVAQPYFDKTHLRMEKISFLLLGLASAAIASYALVYVENFSPNAVDDPAMILFVLASLGGLSAIITFIRLAHEGNAAANE